ncbi:MAG: 4Fe-4S binding protein [Desulfobacterales bacterium]|nr:4Fe-4S binding protein [Desulfobacterales bacterium]
MPYQISENCIGCSTCAKKCPENAIDGEIKVRFDIDEYLCQECGTCFDTCPNGAIIDPQGNRSTKKRKKKKLARAHIDPDICAGCKTCFLNCPQEAIRVVKKGIILTITYCRVDTGLCIGCGTCTLNCITGAAELS